MRSRVIFEKRDLWVGAFWDRRHDGLHVYVCLIPTLVWHTVFGRESRDVAVVEPEHECDGHCILSHRANYPESGSRLEHNQEFLRLCVALGLDPEATPSITEAVVAAESLRARAHVDDGAPQ